MFYYCGEVRGAEEEEKRRRRCCSPVIQLAAGSGILAVAHLALPKWSPLQGGVIVYQITERFHRTLLCEKSLGATKLGVLGFGASLGVFGVSWEGFASVWGPWGRI